MIKVMRTINDEIQYQDINEEYLNQFKRRGWLEAPKGAKEPVKETVQIPTQPDFENLDTEVLIGMAVENGMKKIKALKTSKEDLITFLKS